MSVLPGLTEPVYFTLAEVVGLWPLDDGGLPVGEMAIDALYVDGYLASAEYREFGRDLFAARLAHVDPNDVDQLAGRLVGALATATSADSLLMGQAIGSEDRKVLAFSAGTIVAEFALAEAGFGVSVLPVVDTVEFTVGRLLTDLQESVHLERRFADHSTLGAAWGRGVGFVLDQQTQEWHESADVSFGDAAEWLADRLQHRDRHQ